MTNLREWPDESDWTEEIEARRIHMNNPSGEWRCLRCHYVLYKRLLYAATMGIAVDIKDTQERCPNDGKFLVPSVSPTA